MILEDRGADDGALAHSRHSQRPCLRSQIIGEYRDSRMRFRATSGAGASTEPAEQSNSKERNTLHEAKNGFNMNNRRFVPVVFLFRRRSSNSLTKRTARECKLVSIFTFPRLFAFAVFHFHSDANPPPRGEHGNEFMSSDGRRAATMKIIARSSVERRFKNEPRIIPPSRLTSRANELLAIKRANDSLKFAICESVAIIFQRRRKFNQKESFPG